MKKNESTEWQWYSVKLIFRIIISGEPEPDTIDKNYTDNSNIYEESIFLIRAHSFSQAYEIAERKAKEVEDEYINPYGQLVRWVFVNAIDCFSLHEDILGDGVELSSRLISVPGDVEPEDFINKYYPETLEDSSEVDKYYIIRNRDFNRRPNS